MKKNRTLICLALIVALATLVITTALAKTDTFNFSVGATFGDRDEFNFEVKMAGTIKVQAMWTGSASQLALILNGPGQVGYYQRIDGPSPVIITQEVTSAILTKGTGWKASIVNFNGSGYANGTIQIDYPGLVPIVVPPIIILPKHYKDFDRLLITDIEKTTNKAIITVAYTLNSKHTVPVFMGAGMMSGDNEAPGFGFKPAAVGAGSGTAKVEISTTGNQAVTTNKVSVYLYEGGKYPFARFTQDQILDWNK